MPNGYINGLDLTIKTTNVPQTCFYCDKAISKGEKRVKMTDGAYYNHPTYSYYHFKCFQEGIAKLYKEGGEKHA